MGEQDNDLLWWLIPGELAGMPMPFVDPWRRENLGGDLRDYDDELPVLWDVGVRSVICLLNLPSDQPVYESAGFQFLCLPIRNGKGLELETEIEKLRKFCGECPKALAVHCEAGLGRTGTVLAAILMFRGSDANVAISRVRKVQPAAIETADQVRFLEEL